MSGGKKERVLSPGVQRTLWSLVQRVHRWTLSLAHNRLSLSPWAGKTTGVQQLHKTQQRTSVPHAPNQLRFYRPNKKGPLVPPVYNLTWHNKPSFKTRDVTCGWALIWWDSEGRQWGRQSVSPEWRGCSHLRKQHKHVGTSAPGRGLGYTTSTLHCFSGMVFRPLNNPIFKGTP